jgi:ABC-type nitrate/sulfonate/bicarbonate transport system permease component
MRKIVAWLVVFGFLFAIWHFALTLRFVSPAALATPTEVIKAFPRLFMPGDSLRDTAATIARSAVAFLLAAPIGMLAGLAVSFSRDIRTSSEFVLDFLRSIPATALVPVFLIVFGVDESAKISVGTFSAALVVALSTLAGLGRTNINRAAVASTLGIVGFRRMILLDIPEAMPQIFLGFRAGASLALILVIIAEMFIGTRRGLGRVIWDMRYTDDLGMLYAAIVVTGVIGYSFNFVIRLAEKRLLHWHGR